MTTIQTWANEEAGQTQNNAELMANDDLGNIPLVVLASSAGNNQWRQVQQMMAGLSSNSRFEIVPESDHLIHWDHPDIVIGSVLDVIGSVRTGTRLN